MDPKKALNQCGTPKFEFSAKVLNQLAEDEKSGVKVRRNCSRVFQLKNKFVGSFVKGVTTNLQSSIPQYDIELDGLIMDYKNVKILGPVFGQDCTLFDSSMAVKVSFDIYYLPFTLGSILRGEVSHVETKHLICLVHNIFHVSVLKPYSTPFEEWGGSQVKVGDTIEFRITAKLLREDIPYIQGELLNVCLLLSIDHTGIYRELRTEVLFEVVSKPIWKSVQLTVNTFGFVDNGGSVNDNENEVVLC